MRFDSVTGKMPGRFVSKRASPAAVLAGVCIVLMASATRAETFDTCKGFIDSVPATIYTQGLYCLRKDLSTTQSTGNAITVSANNVTIDCNGYKIGGLAAGLDTRAFGIKTSEGQENTTVRNCNVRGFFSGVELVGAGHVVENSSFDQNTYGGISVTGRGGLIRNNRVRDTGGSDYQLSYGIAGYRGTDIRGNTVDGVVGRSGNNVSVIGIFVLGKGVSAFNNTVRSIVPGGSGTADGIRASGFGIFLDRNRVSTSAAGSLGFKCEGLSGAMRGNSSWGFTTPDEGCHDSGGNLAY